MSNLYKYQIVTEAPKIRKIDTNALLQEKLGNLNPAAGQVRALTEESGGSEAVEEGFRQIDFGGLEAAEESPRLKNMLERHRRRAPHQELMDDMLEAARIEADTIVLDARDRVEEIRQEAFEEGRQAGFEEGKTLGQQEGFEQSYEAGRQKLEAEEAMLAQRGRELDHREEELKLQEENLERRYRQRFEELEPVLVRTISTVFDKVFQTNYIDKQDILLHLVKKSLNKIENSKEFFVRVSREDFDFMMSHKEEITERVGRSVELGIMEDPSLEKGQCVVETDGGVFDCGIDTQLQNLLSDLRTLSI